MNSVFYGRDKIWAQIWAMLFITHVTFGILFHLSKPLYMYNRNDTSNYLKSSCILRTNAYKITISQFSFQYIKCW